MTYRDDPDADQARIAALEAGKPRRSCSTSRSPPIGSRI